MLMLTRHPNAQQAEAPHAPASISQSSVPDAVRFSRGVTICRLLLAGLAIASLALGACGFGQDQVTGRVGETLTAGDYQLLVSSVNPHAERPDRFTNPKVGNRFVTTSVTVTNVGQQYLPVAASHFTIIDTAGIENPALPGVPSDTGLRATSLSPGQKMDTTLYFEVASNQQPAKLIFAPQVVGWRTRIEVNLQ